MSTATISAEIKSSDIPLFETLLKRVKAKSIKIEEKDPTEMSKKDFFEMVDKRSKEKDIEISRENLRKMMFE